MRKHIDYYEVKFYIKDLQTYESLRKALKEFVSSDEFAKHIVLLHQTGVLKPLKINEW